MLQNVKIWVWTCASAQKLVEVQKLAEVFQLEDERQVQGRNTYFSALEVWRNTAVYLKSVDVRAEFGFFEYHSKVYDHFSTLPLQLWFQILQPVTPVKLEKIRNGLVIILVHAKCKGCLVLRFWIQAHHRQ